MGFFNDPAWKVCGGWWVVWWGGWLTPTTYIQLTGAGSTNSVQIHTFPSYYVDLYSADPLGQQNMK